MPTVEHALWNHRLCAWRRHGGSAAMTRLWDAVITSSLAGRGVPARVVRAALARARGRSRVRADTANVPVVLIVYRGADHWLVAPSDFRGIARDVAVIREGDAAFGVVDGQVLPYAAPPEGVTTAVRAHRDGAEVLLPADGMELGRRHP